MSTTQRADAVQREVAVLHGRDLSYVRYPGVGVPLVLLHGVGSSAAGWETSAAILSGRGVPVIAIDMPGHGESAKGPGDYSLGSMASAVRDLLDHLGIDRAVIVGHSLGGGVALQFHYQYPSYVVGLVLVSSGGLGQDANLILRLLSLPGAGVVLQVGLNPRTMSALDSLRQQARRLTRRPDLIPDRVMDRIDRLSDPDGRHSFLATLRSVVDHTGQRVSALEKLHLSNDVPVLIVWGAKDSILPVAHGENAHDLLDSSTFVVFDDAGHEPHRKDPARFADALQGWLRDNGLAGPTA
ncbi:MAG: Alpha/beta fold hydrolase [Actinomycetota bacterium]|nr:Alpha/beta fold hydrolase [Actinomycetota bacterium]